MMSNKVLFGIGMLFLIVFSISSSAHAIIKCKYQTITDGKAISQICYDDTVKPTIVRMPVITEVRTTSSPYIRKPTIVRMPVITVAPVRGCATDRDCPLGSTCFLPPIPVCTTSRCPQLMPARPYCRPTSCSLRMRGDANCDQKVDNADFIELQKKLNNKPTCIGCIVDFNSDSMVDLRDYEIWRNEVYK